MRQKSGLEKVLPRTMGKTCWPLPFSVSEWSGQMRAGDSISKFYIIGCLQGVVCEVINRVFGRLERSFISMSFFLVWDVNAHKIEESHRGRVS